MSPLKTRCCATALLLAGCGLLLGSTPGEAAAGDAVAGEAVVDGATAVPRATVERVAALIQSHYFDAAKGAAIAAALRSAEQSGEFDPLRRPLELATALTTLLHPLDHHFRVLWSSESGQYLPSSGPSGPFFASADAIERRTAYGFRRVEMLPGALGYIELQSFADLADGKRADPARAAVNAALQLVSGAQALIVDLRDNVGGSSDMAAYLISAFTPPSADIYDVIHWRNGTDSERPVLRYAQPRLQVPLYLLISARTASAAEAAAYTLHAAGRAVIVGQTSAGAANVGGIFPLGGGFGVFIPIGTPINPLTGGNWEGKGVAPDYPVAAQAALPYAEELALTTLLERNPAAPEAAYLRRVLEALRAQAAHRAGPPLRSYAGVYSGTVVTATGGVLGLRQGDRMPWTLVRLQGDVFFDQGDPGRGVVFERGAAGTITGLKLVYPNGHEVWFPAQAARLPPLRLPPTSRPLPPPRPQASSRGVGCYDSRAGRAAV